MQAVLRIVFGNPFDEGYTIPAKFHMMELGKLFHEAYSKLYSSHDLLTVKQAYQEVGVARQSIEEWERIQIGTRLNVRAPQRGEKAERIYEFSGYISCVHCGLNLRCKGAHPGIAYAYYKDMAKSRAYPCPAGGYLQVRTDRVMQQFGELLQGLRLPIYWRDMVRQQMVEAAQKVGFDPEAMEREKECLRLKRGRILKQHREGYIEDEEMEAEIAAVELALRALEVPETNGVRLEEVIEAGERLPGMAALWNVAIVEERCDMVMQILEPGGLHYDVEQQVIAAITPRPAFLPVLRMLEEVMEYEEATGTLVTSRWQQRNRRESGYRQLHQWDSRIDTNGFFIQYVSIAICISSIHVPTVVSSFVGGSGTEAMPEA